MSTAILQVRNELVVGLLREMDGIAIEAGCVEKGVSDGDLIVGFPLGKIERVRWTGGSRLVIMAVRCNGGHVPGVVTTPPGG